jgi:hypothetical protein
MMAIEVTLCPNGLALSDHVRPKQVELEIEPRLRNLLLSGLQRDYGEERVRRVAALLEQYTGASVAWRGWPELDAAQRLTAPASPLNSQNRPCGPGRTTSRACGNPGSRPGSRAIVIPRR